MTIEIRATQPDEHRTASATVSAALLFAVMTDDEWADREQSWVDSASVSAWEDGRCVGHAGAFRFDTTVPGGARLATYGVTRVGVLPTHTRRGLLTSMMTDLLVGARAEGTPLASLRASEAVIYARYGFGVAGEAVAASVQTRAARPVRNPGSGSIRILASDEIVTVIPDLYDHTARRRVGTISRSEDLIRRYFADAIEGKKASFVAVHAAADGPLDGYVHYDVRWREREAETDIGSGEIHELWAADDAAERALWSYVFDIDLIQEWKLNERPVEDSLRFAIADPRAYRLVERYDEQWLRVLDVDAALNSRTYASSDASFTVAVTDPMFIDNNATWSVSSKGAERTAAAADLSIDIATLGAAYLGGTSWRELADGGRISVSRESAVVDADTLFATHPSPFCCSWF